MVKQEAKNLLLLLLSSLLLLLLFRSFFALFCMLDIGCQVQLYGGPAAAM